MKVKNRMLVMVLTGVMALSCTGCEINSDTPVIGKLVGLKENEVIKVGTSICTVEEAKLVLMNLQNQYKKDFGGSVDWKQSMGDTTMEEYILGKVKSDLSIVYAMSALASKEKITLDDKETAIIGQAAKAYFDGLNQSEKEYTGATVEIVERLYTNYYLADKIYKEKTGAISDSVSDEEARVMKIQYIYIDTSKTDPATAKDTLEKVKKQVENGYQDFMVQANKHTDSQVVEVKLKKNEAVKDYEIKAFEMTDNTISDVIVQEDGMYLVKCVNSYLEGATKENKLQIIMDSKIKAVNKSYSSYVEDNSKDFNKEAWDEIDIVDDANVVAVNLFDVYDQYVATIDEK